ncbi:ABC transporter ATP-binding protein [Halobacteriales archaeon QS_4_66_20]|nr:MAG: ABC transporter ATP-binding protein [Halobacteriales archaeon QS_4_66_20]
MSEQLLQVDDLSVRYHTASGPVAAVSDVSFSIDEGEYFGLVGESGSGKSTAAMAIMGGLASNGEVTSGSISYRGEDITDLSERELREKLRWKEVAWIPQGSMSSLDPMMRLHEQALGVGRRHSDLSDEEIGGKFRDMFEVVALQRERATEYPHQFSGGMQQRALIALALFLEPSLIIADEPTTALDVIMQDQVFKYLDAAREELATSMLLITHDISLVFESCDRMGVMHAGQLAESGSVRDVYDSPRHPYTFLLQGSFPDIRYPERDLEVIEGDPPQLLGDVAECTFADRCPFAVEECRELAPPLEPVEAGEDPDHRVACIRSEEAYDEYQQRRADADEATGREEIDTGSKEAAGTAATEGFDEDAPLFEVRNLEKYFDRNRSLLDSLFDRNDPVQAVDDVSLTLSETDARGVIGESGCGKTTLLKTLVGLESPTGGEILFKGRDVAEFGRTDWKRFRSDVQLIFQDPFNSLDPKFTVEETLREPLAVHSMDDRDRRVREACEQVGLTPPERYLGRLPDQLSGGEKQRVSIARALVVDPDVLLADEPVSMLDVSTQTAVLELLSDLVEELGLAMLYISHDLSTVSYVCNEIDVMYLGRVVESGPTADILADPKHPYSQALINAVPVPDPNADRERTVMEGAPREPIGVGDGCRFRDRCPDAMEVCERTPHTVPVDGTRDVACHLYYDHESETTDGAASDPVADDAGDGTTDHQADEQPAGGGN